MAKIFFDQEAEPIFFLRRQKRVHPKGSTKALALPIATLAHVERTIKWAHDWTTRACLCENNDLVLGNVHLEESLGYCT